VIAFKIVEAAQYSDVEKRISGNNIGSPLVFPSLLTGVVLSLSAVINQ
jgi:hypothetical protein